MMLPTRGRLLIYGYGNPARGDDGLGPAVAGALEHRPWTGVRVESNYQLELEDVALLTGFDTAVFVDADISGPEPFWFDRVRPASRLGWTSHAMAPEALVYLAKQLFSHDVEAYALGIRGYEFDQLAEKLTRRAQQNLQLALEFLTQALKEQDFDMYVERYRGRSGPVGRIEPETPSASIQSNRGPTTRGTARQIGAKCEVVQRPRPVGDVEQPIASIDPRHQGYRQ